MADVQDLAKELCVHPNSVLLLIQKCAREGLFPKPERKEKNGPFVLTEEMKEILRQKWDEKERTADYRLLARELFLSPDGLEKMIWRMVKKGLMPSPKKVGKGLVLTFSQKQKIREYYRWIGEPAPTTRLARELGVSQDWVIDEIKRLVEKGKFPQPPKRQRGHVLEFVLSPEMEEAIKESFNHKERS